ncbi:MULTISPECIES: hypothetical protein [Acinetobacter]|uniref:Uncharacterized protein n=3 Tax=Acinetobacter TaxID=469 RepID=A0AA46NU97_9GAMM|nr:MULTISPECIES: hypothetical protein [Acinetobacter]UKC63528.1 hypothetical protein FA267_2_00054 [Acinetobacter nosocomialis]UKC63708.1 hypothetical protein FA648_2_00099 [Acinetobacter nosocomialis]UYF77350.1 hypothetical protein LSO58_18600 [Acinetobacter ursingii]WOF72164.1 hypothetical protein [Acinetobacter junii]
MAITRPDWITDQMWNAMCNAKMSLPSSIDQADLSKPFVYDRSYGVFFVPSGSHQVAMSLLLAWKNQEKNGVRVAEKLGLSYSDGTADYYLEHIQGTAFLSSVGKRICAGKKSNLNELEKEYFGIINYLFD